MKAKMYMTFIFMLLFIGCGAEINTDTAVADLNNPITNQETTFSVTIVVPVPMFGSRTSILYNGKHYAAGFETPSTIRNYIHNLAPGNYNKTITGTFDRESGHPPVPTATYDVIQISSMQN